jgi:hypothetical protein
MLLKYIIVLNFEIFKKIIKNAREIKEKTIRLFC